MEVIASLGEGSEVMGVSSSGLVGCGSEAIARVDISAAIEVTAMLDDVSVVMGASSEACDVSGVVVFTPGLVVESVFPGCGVSGVGGEKNS